MDPMDHMNEGELRKLSRVFAFEGGLGSGVAFETSDIWSKELARDRGERRGMTFGRRGKGLDGLEKT